MCTCTRTKGARVRPTSRAYGDADPGLVCPTATSAAVAAVMVLEAHCCCRCRTSVQVELWWHLLLRNMSCFCWTKHMIYMQIFRPRNTILMNFNQKTLLNKTCQVLCALDSFYPSTSSTTVSVPIFQSLRDTSSVVSSADFVFKLIYMPDFEVETRIHPTKSSTFSYTNQEQERPRKFTKIIGMHPRRRTVVVQ